MKPAKIVKPSMPKHEDIEVIPEVAPLTIPVFSLKSQKVLPQLQMKKLVAQMKHLANQTAQDHMEYDVYVDVYYEWLKLMKHLGKCVSIGFNDLIHKAECMESNRLLLTE